MQKTTDKQQTQECCHYWILGQPNNGLTEGICRLCGIVKEFISSQGLWTKGDTSLEINAKTA